MFIVINSTGNGCYTPSVFSRESDALTFKRNWAMYNAYNSEHYLSFNRMLDEHDTNLFDNLFTRIGKNMTVANFSEEERMLLNAFESHLINKNCTFGEKTDHIVYSDESYNYIEIFDVSGPCDIQTSAGKATAVAYDDGIANGIQVLLDNTIVCMLDIYGEEDGGEARVLIYRIQYPEGEEELPIACITINR